MAVSVLVEALGEDFMKYMELFKPFLFLALRNTAAASVCSSAIGVAGDVCRNFQKKILPYADELMQVLLETLSVSNQLCSKHEGQLLLMIFLVIYVCRIQMLTNL